GVHERMHRTLKQEATIPPASSLRAQQRKFDCFREDFNQVRPHEAIGMKRPGQIYHPCNRRMPRRIEAYDYPSHFIVRRVSRAGTIRVFGKQFFVSNTLHEDDVGLEEVDDGVYDIFFGFYQIGRYDLSNNKIQDTVSRVPMTRAWADHPSKL
ncbi:MAG: transposase, partial [Anaerolineales bacterium]|nr:transposase [Anaerolineales bacterium]